MKQDKALAMIGLAAKGGNVVSGGFSVEKAIKSKKASLVILASDASDNSKKHFSDMCAYRKIPCMEYALQEQLGKCIGKEHRVCLAFLDGNLAEAIIKKIEEIKRLNHGGNE